MRKQLNAAKLLNASELESEIAMACKRLCLEIRKEGALQV